MATNTSPNPITTTLKCSKKKILCTRPRSPVAKAKNPQNRTLSPPTNTLNIPTLIGSLTLNFRKKSVPKAPKTFPSLAISKALNVK